MPNCFTGIFTAIIVYCKVVINHIVLRLYKHSCNLFPPVTDGEQWGVWNMFLPCLKCCNFPKIYSVFV